MGNGNHEDRQDKRNIELCRRIKQNDPEAENHLLIENEGLILNIVLIIEKKYSQDDLLEGGIERDDLIQEGRIAMLRAVWNYDEETGTRFSTYAYSVMKNAMTDYCEKGLSGFEKRMERSGQTRIFLNDDCVDEEGIPTIERVRTGEDDLTGNLATLHVMLEKMRNRFLLLPERQKILLAYRYGIGLLEDNSLEDTAVYFHITEKYAAAIERDALRMLRRGMNDGEIT